MTAIGIYGGTGRMARAVAEAADNRGVSIAGIAGRGDDAASLAQSADVLIDFSLPEALNAHLSAALSVGKPIVIGTTGLSGEDNAAIDRATHKIAVLQAGNTSLGITLLAKLVRDATARLGPDWDIEIVEMHHRHKRDAPSGTALLLGEAAAEGRNAMLDELRAADRTMIDGPRRAGTIGFASLRGGSVAGDHQVILAADGERIELGHRAENRSVFARGAIAAALWLIDSAPGRYTMADVLEP